MGWDSPSVVVKHVRPSLQRKYTQLGKGWRNAPDLATVRAWINNVTGYKHRTNHKEK